MMVALILLKIWGNNFMITIKSVNYITTEDVEKLTGKHWGDFEFAQMAENDSYQILDCSEDRLEDLKDDFEDAEEPSVEDYEDEEQDLIKEVYIC